MVFLPYLRSFKDLFKLATLKILTLNGTKTSEQYFVDKISKFGWQNQGLTNDAYMLLLYNVNI